MPHHFSLTSTVSLQKNPIKKTGFLDYFNSKRNKRRARQTADL